MNFQRAIVSGFQNYVNFNGRAARSEVWDWVLFVFLVNVAANLVDAVIGLGIIGALASLALFLPGIAVSVRRLHDLDRTGWGLLIAPTGIGILLLLVGEWKEGHRG